MPMFQLLIPGVPAILLGRAFFQQDNFILAHRGDGHVSLDPSKQWRMDLFVSNISGQSDKKKNSPIKVSLKDDFPMKSV